MTSRAGSSFAAFPSIDVSAVSALAPGETGSVAPASPILPCRGCGLSKGELQPGVAYQNSSSRRSASASRPRDRRIARRGTLGDFTRVGAPRAVRYRARGRHGGENRIRWAPRAPPSASSLVIYPWKTTDQSQPSQARIDLFVGSPSHDDLLLYPTATAHTRRAEVRRDPARTRRVRAYAPRAATQGRLDVSRAEGGRARGEASRTRRRGKWASGHVGRE